MLWEEVQKIQDELDTATVSLKENGMKWAAAERDYRKKKSQEILRLHAEHIPTTLIPDVVKGLDEVADLDFIRNTWSVVYKACQEEINVKKIELKNTEAELERDYENIK